MSLCGLWLVTCFLCFHLNYQLILTSLCALWLFTCFLCFHLDYQLILTSLCALWLVTCFLCFHLDYQLILTSLCALWLVTCFLCFHLNYQLILTSLCDFLLWSILSIKFVKFLRAQTEMCIDFVHISLNIDLNLYYNYFNFRLANVAEQLKHSIEEEFFNLIGNIPRLVLNYCIYTVLTWHFSFIFSHIALLCFYYGDFQCSNTH